MALTFPTLTKRTVKGTPLSAAEGDGNWDVIKNFCQGLANLIGVSLNGDGTLKNGALNSTSQISDLAILFKNWTAIDAMADDDIVTVWDLSENAPRKITAGDFKTYVVASLQAAVDAMLVATRFKPADADMVAIPAAANYADFSHGLTVVPDLVLAKFVCTATNGEYLAGDEVSIESIYGEYSAGERFPAFSVTSNASIVRITRRASSLLQTQTRDTGAEVNIDTTKWKIRVVAIKYAAST